MSTFIFPDMRVLVALACVVFLTFLAISITTGLPPQGFMPQNGPQEQFSWPGPRPKQPAKDSSFGKLASLNLVFTFHAI